MVVVGSKKEEEERIGRRTTPCTPPNSSLLLLLFTNFFYLFSLPSLVHYARMRPTTILKRNFSLYFSCFFFLHLPISDSFLFVVFRIFIFRVPPLNLLILSVARWLWFRLAVWPLDGGSCFEFLKNSILIFVHNFQRAIQRRFTGRRIARTAGPWNRRCLFPLGRRLACHKKS